MSITDAQQKAFGDAAKNAAKRLVDKRDCLKLIGSEGFAKLQNSKFQFGIIESDTGSGVAGSNTYAAANRSANTVTINVLGFFFSMYTSKKVWSDEGYAMEVFDARVDKRLSVEDNRALILLHEIAHLTGALGDDRNDLELSNKFSNRIAEDCFGKK
jgi:hypothetical protein